MTCGNCVGGIKDRTICPVCNGTPETPDVVAEVKELKKDSPVKKVTKEK